MRRPVVALVLAALALPGAAHAGPLPLDRVTTGPSGGNADVYTDFLLSSADGRRAIFTTDEALTPDDHRFAFDFYERVGDVTRLLAQDTGQDDPRHSMPIYGASSDATRIVFSGGGHWTADDLDDHFTADVYTAKDRVVERVSQGPTGGNANSFSAEPAGLSGDGARIVFESAENLTADDTDHATRDVFLREGGVTTRLSAGPAGGNGHGLDAEVVGQSDDARRIFMRTPERLTANDTDTRFDLYVRSGGQTVKVSPGNGPHDAHLGAVSADGGTVVLHTMERLTGDDADDRADAYRVAGATVTRVSTGPTGGNSNEHNVGDEPDRFGGDVLFLSRDGARVVFDTFERLTADDTDDQLDSYLWSAAGVERVTTGPTGGNGNVTGGWETPAVVLGASDDASHLVFVSRERLTADDGDDRNDLYERAGGVTRRVTTGPSGGNGPVEAVCLPPPADDWPCGRLSNVSADGARIVFETEERLVPEDTDDRWDVYQRAGGVTTLLSPAWPDRAPVYGERDYHVYFEDASLDGSIAYVQSEEQMTADDRNLRPDGYRVLPPAPGVVVPGAGGYDPGSDLGGGAGGAAGGAASGTPAAPATTAPRSAARVRLRWRPRSLRLTRGRTRIARRGAGLPLALSRATAVRVGIERILGGRRDGPACRPPSARLRRARPCLRAVAVARPLRMRASGRAVLRLGTRFGPAALRTGRHRVTVTPLDRAGRPGPPLRLTLRLRR